MTRSRSQVVGTRLIRLAAVAVALLARLVLDISDTQAETPRSVTGKKVISFGWDMPSATEFSENCLLYTSPSPRDRG